MAVGFGSVPFAVLTDADGYLPQPPRYGEDGTGTLTLTVRATPANVRLLEGKTTPAFTIKRAHGFRSGGDVVPNGGPGPMTLVLPSAAGDERSFVAILRAVTAREAVFAATEAMADLDLVVLHEITA